MFILDFINYKHAQISIFVYAIYDCYFTHFNIIYPLHIKYFCIQFYILNDIIHFIYI